jgi:hypothetical protein
MNGLYIKFENPDIHHSGSEAAGEAGKKRVFGIPAGKRAFEYFFEPILPDLQQYYWYAQGFQSTPFVDLMYKPGGLEELVECFILIPEFKDRGACGMNCGIIPKHAKYLRDDGLDLVGLPGPESNFKALALELFQAFDGPAPQAAKRNAYFDLIQKHSDACFFCEDGRSWEIYTKLDDLLTKVVDRVKSMHAITFKTCTLHKRDAELFNNWGIPE